MVTPQGDGSYAAVVPPGWDIVGATNGGYLLCLAMSAMRADLGESVRPVSATMHFFEAVSAGDMTIGVQRLREGSRFASASAQLRGVDGCLHAAALATVARLPEEEGSRSDAPSLMVGEPPSLPPVQECIRVEPTETFPPPLMGKVTLHLPPDQVGFATGSPSGRAEMKGWFSLPEDEELSADALLLAADAFPPTVFNAALPVAWTPTVELTVQVRGRPRGTHLRCSFVSRYIADGFLEADGEIWDTDGRLLALSRQLALVPRA